MSALKLSGAEIRQAFLDFYSQRGHQPLPSGSLVPEDPTVLLTILQGERLGSIPMVRIVQMIKRQSD